MRVSGLFAAAIIASNASFAVSAQFDFSNEYNANSIHAQGDQFFIEKVKELSKGDVDITLHSGGALGYKSADHFYAVADNAVQIADTLAGTMSGIDPIFLLSSLPFLVENEDQAGSFCIRLLNLITKKSSKIMIKSFFMLHLGQPVVSGQKKR